MSFHRVYSVAVFIVLASLDNVAISLVPPLYSPISRSLGVGEGALGVVTAVGYLVTAVAAVGWAYAGDRTDRKPVLMVGTLIWAGGTVGTVAAQGYWSFLTAQLVAAVGLGAVGSVGFSVVSDLISPRRRGLVMSLWGLSQGVGTLAGVLVASQLGGADWRRPFVVLAVLGVLAAAAYFTTADIRRGQSEPDLAAVFAAGEEYEHRISRAELPGIVARRTNVWLILQGLTAQAAFGSLVWLPRLFQARAEAQGYDEQSAIQIGGILATLFQLGGVLSVVGGLLGDRWQRRDPGGRAKVAAIGILAGVPLYVVLFFAPLSLPAPDGRSATALVFGAMFTTPSLLAAFLCALLALALTSANSPNWFALIADANPPEHRGTVYSLGNLVNGVGRAAGNGVVGAVFAALARSFPPPTNLAVGLAAFQAFFIPTGVMYWLASRTAPADIEAVHDLLRARAAAEIAGADGAGGPAAGPAPAAGPTTGSAGGTRRPRR
ncbi:MFS transporter [Dactylosporangium aurantiacum]|uniref:MFS transporter n=1 Tax=Dactylosporangium aurantiacum TaxID=35754 RepID=A0A9Q9IM97_9ACTN|nr:MFS transporter [Dactylosporangium aurantiacum]MDG6109202.1 MFS transporter [Dactylosporangium aurantiacum]UWZ56600.1 MFS transporter [Dactylosporangium aurantiacum]